jgi:hypothetical protein
MSAKAERTITLVFSGDVRGTQEIEAADVDASVATVGQLAISAGNATITIPTGAKSVTIVKPSDHTGIITLKGVAGDTGVKLHPTDPDTISLHSTMTTFVLTVSVDVIIRTFWT